VPSRERVEAFYADDATMQENNDPPRIGRARLIEHERKVMAASSAIEATLVDDFLLEGDRVVIRWRFDFLRRTGEHVVLDELAYQRWRGDRIVEERFYYDPAQLRSAR
jgi:ketosteroid isomerase-like protein